MLPVRPSWNLTVNFLSVCYVFGAEFFFIRIYSVIDIFMKIGTVKAMLYLVSYINLYPYFSLLSSDLTEILPQTSEHDTVDLYVLVKISTEKAVLFGRAWRNASTCLP